MKKMLFDVALACLIFYTGMLLLVYFLQDRLLYFPFKEIDVTPAALQLAFEDVRLTTEDGANTRRLVDTGRKRAGRAAFLPWQWRQYFPPP